MDVDFTPEDMAFREEVRTLLKKTIQSIWARWIAVT